MNGQKARYRHCRDTHAHFGRSRHVVIVTRNTVKHDELVRIEGQLLMSDCEDCLDMEVMAIRPKGLGLMVEEIIDPYSAEIDLTEIVYAAVKAGGERRFCLTGRLHRYPEWDRLAEPPYAYPFLIESIDQNSPCFP